MGTWEKKPFASLVVGYSGTFAHASTRSRAPPYHHGCHSTRPASGRPLGASSKATTQLTKRLDRVPGSLLGVGTTLVGLSSHVFYLMSTNILPSKSNFRPLSHNMPFFLIVSLAISQFILYFPFHSSFFSRSSARRGNCCVCKLEFPTDLRPRLTLLPCCRRRVA